MKKSTKNIIYVILLVVIIYLIYKAYTNYQSSGSIFRSIETDIYTGEPPVTAIDAASRFSLIPSGVRSIVPGYISGRDCLKMCPTCTWTTNGGCYPPSKVVVRN